MQTKHRDIFTTVRTEGALLPADFLTRVTEGDRGIEGLAPEAYHLIPGEKINEAINRSWNRLLGAWTSLRSALEKLPENDPATSVTRERWLLPLFQELGYGRLQTSKAVEIEGKLYPCSHSWQQIPIHLVGYGVSLDKVSAGVAGAARSSPHSLLQEFLNRSADHLWGFVSNGRQLRILRDNISFTRQAYVQFELESMMDGEVYADFVILWLICHQSRVEAESPEQCFLEKWSKSAQEQGTRVLDQLRVGVEEAIAALGRGFMGCPANTSLRENLKSGGLTTQDFYRQLLRTVYRLLFIFVAEDRDLLLDPHASREANDRYLGFYSTTKLRRLAERRRGTKHVDIWRGVTLIFRKLGDEHGCPELGLPPLDSFLWSDESAPAIDGCDIENRYLLDAVRALTFAIDRNVRRAVDYRNLGTEELGSIYESLLELQPVLNIGAEIFSLTVAQGHERKTTGSYYTPSSLTSCLLDSALEPVLDEASKKPDPETALLNLKICDPACGSGHFLIAAAHRIAKRLASVRTGDEESAPKELRRALRDVIGRCIYGVDINPMAVELCKVSLWMEALEPGKPLSFLEHKIQCGNSLLGATPALLERGIPEEAFKTADGDDKKLCAFYRKQNEGERRGEQNMFTQFHEPWDRLGDLAATIVNLERVEDDTIQGVCEKQRRYADLVRSSGYLYGRLWADAWCAAFMWEKVNNPDLPYPITEQVFRQIEKSPFAIPNWMRDEIQRLSDQYQFFHWHLAFPDVFRFPTAGEEPENEQTGWSGGFDVVLGNPPWVRQETLKPIKKLLPIFSSFTSTSDSSVYFLELSVLTCRHFGNVGLLTPNKWFRASYGERLRKFLRERCRVDLLIDFGHSRNLFPDADTFPAAVVLQAVDLPVQNAETARFVQAHDSDRERYSLPELISAHAVEVPHKNLRPDRWHLEASGPSDLLDRLMATGLPLENLLVRPGLSGLKTGFNEAFYVQTSLRDAMLETDSGAEHLFRKLLRGRDIKRWVPQWADLWHIVIPSSHNYAWPWSNATSEAEAESVFAATYPSVYGHLKRFEQRLRTRQDRGVYWWELRACDYYGDFDSSKMIVQYISYYSQFSFDDQGYYVNNMGIIIPTDDLYLLAILNSRVVWWLINRTFPHKKDEAASVEVQFLKKLPMPSVSNDLRDEIITLVRDLLSTVHSSEEHNIAPLEMRLNDLVEEAFALTESERRVLVSSLPPRDPIQILETR